MYQFKQAEKLDTVLRYMTRGGLPIYQSALDISKGLKTNKSEQTELYLILNKLVKDEFVEAKEREYQPQPYVLGPPLTIVEYIITFEGLYHVESGGYLQQEKDRHAVSIHDKRESIRADKLRTDQMAIQRSTDRLTLWIAAGTIVAALYYSVEIYKELHQFSHRHGVYWFWETIPKK